MQITLSAAGLKTDVMRMVREQIAEQIAHQSGSADVGHGVLHHLGQEFNGVADTDEVSLEVTVRIATTKPAVLATVVEEPAAPRPRKRGKRGAR